MFDNFVVKKKEIVNKIEPIFIFIFKIISREKKRRYSGTFLVTLDTVGRIDCWESQGTSGNVNELPVLLKIIDIFNMIIH